MMARQCDCCGEMIRQFKYLELQIRLLLTEEDSNQDAILEYHADYCDECIKSGKALTDLLETDPKLLNREVKT